MMLHSALVGHGKIHSLVLIRSKDITDDDPATFAYTEHIAFALVDDTGEYNERRVEGDLPHYSASLDFIVAQNRPALRAFLQEEAEEDFICTFGDMNGHYYKAGTVDYPLRLKSRMKTGRTLESRNQVQFELDGVLKYPAEFIGALDSSFFYAEQVSKLSGITLQAGIPKVISHPLNSELFIIEAFDAITKERIANLRARPLDSSNIEVLSLVNKTVNLIIVA